MTVTVDAEDPSSRDACALIAELSAALTAITGASGQASFDVADVRVARARFAIARDAAVPVIEDASLARLLYATTAGSRTIAPETYVAVAQIVAELVHAGLLS